MFINKNPLIVQIKVFIKYRPKTVTLDERDEESLYSFAHLSRKQDISEITTEDVERFRTHIWGERRGDYQAISTMHKIEALMRYYHYYTKVKVPKRIGRPINIDKIREVKELIDAGYTQRETEEKTGVNLSLVNRYSRYEFDKNGNVLK